MLPLFSLSICIVLFCTCLLPNIGSAQFPHDSSFAAGKAIVTFRPSVIKRSYFCTGHIYVSGSDTIAFQSFQPSIIHPSSSLILDSGTVAFLENNNVELEPMWKCKSPCTDTVEINRWNDTLHFPYWSNYIAHFPDTVSPVVFSMTLQLMYPQAIIRTYPIPARQIYEQTGVPSDPLYDQQLSLFSVFLDPNPFPVDETNYGINVEDAWDLTTGSSDVGMAVFDGEMDPLTSLHRDFYHYPSGGGAAQTNVLKSKEYFNPGTGQSLLHGRRAGLIMSALRNNKNDQGEYEGIAGIAGGDWENGKQGCRLYLAGIIGDYPQGNQTPNLWRNWPEIPIGAALDEITGLDPSCGDCARIVNMSISTPMSGGGKPLLDYPGSPGEYIKYAQAYRRGVMLVNSNGNSLFLNIDATPEDNGGKYQLPGGFSDQWFIGVGGSTREGKRYEQSVYGGSMRLLAPGSTDNPATQNVYSGGSGLTNYGYLTYGSSWAAPHVAATAGLILSRNPDLFNDDVAGVMEGTARQANGQTLRFEKEFGFGILDAAEAVRYATEVRHGVFSFADMDVDKWEELLEDMVYNRHIDNNFDYRIVVQGAESNDPYDYQMGDRWKRFKLRLTVTLPPSIPGQLKHVWGIGQGDGSTYTTTGWEKGVVAERTIAVLPDVITRVEGVWCSETPYAKVDPASIDVINRSFDIVTYFYHNSRDNRFYPVNIMDDAEWSKLRFAYGYLLESIPTTVAMENVDVSSLIIDHIAPVPVWDRSTLRFTTPHNGVFAIEVIDYLGRHLLAFPLGYLSAGTHETDLSFRDIPTGAYICRVINTMTGDYSTRSCIVEK